MKKDPDVLLPWFKVFAERALRCELMRFMSAAAQGMVWRMRCLQWAGHTLPNNPRDLARLMYLETVEVESAWGELGGIFVPHPDDPARLIDPVLYVERSDTETEYKARSETNRVNAKKPRARRKQVVSDSLSNGQRPESESRTDKELDIEGEREREPLPVDTGPSAKPDDRESGATPYVVAARVLAATNAALGWSEPVRADITKNLKSDSPIQELVATYGEEEASGMFVWAYRNWENAPTWKSILANRNQIRIGMGKLAQGGMDAQASRAGDASQRRTHETASEKAARLKAELRANRTAKPELYAAA